MRTSESLANLAPALAQAQAELKSAAKDQQATVTTSTGRAGYQYRYTTLANCIEASRPALAKYGLAVVQGAGTAGQAVTVTTRLLHKSGEWMEDELSLPVARFDAQGIGSAITYGRRYGYCALVGVVADEDDDGAAAVRPAARAQEVPWSAARNPTGTPAVNATTGEETPAILEGSELPPEPTLTVPEQHKLWAVAKARGWTPKEYEHFLITAYHVGASREIPRSKLAAILATLEAGRTTTEAAQ